MVCKVYDTDSLVLEVKQVEKKSLLIKQSYSKLIKNKLTYTANKALSKHRWHNAWIILGTTCSYGHLYIKGILKKI